jgi:opacity protein-like surface antigen
MIHVPKKIPVVCATLLAVVAIGTVSCPILATAQPTLNVFSGVNNPSQIWLPVSPRSAGWHWHTAVNLGLGLEFQVREWLAVSPLIEYNYLRFDSYRPTVISGWPPVMSTGDASHIYRFLVEGKFFPVPDGRIVPYLSTGMAYVVEDMGEIEVKYGYESTFRTLSFENESYVAHSLGVGIRTFVGKTVGIDAVYKYFSNYDDISHVSLNFGLLFRL